MPIVVSSLKSSVSHDSSKIFIAFLILPRFFPPETFHTTAPILQVPTRTMHLTLTRDSRLRFPCPRLYATNNSTSTIDAGGTVIIRVPEASAATRRKCRSPMGRPSWLPSKLIPP